MALEAAGLVVLEVLAILFFLQAAFRQPDPRESAERILRKRMFVVGYFLFGLAVPLGLMLFLYSTTLETGSTKIPVVITGAILGLMGGLILRQAVLICGALPTLNFAGFEFRRIHRPKEPKPDIGMLPPQ
jgi:formate-dependent nitrite reductase membrane component NrfD